MIDSLSHTYHFLARGGPVMAVLFLLSVVCVTLIVERAFSLRRSRVFPRHFMSEFDLLLREKKGAEAYALCRASDAPLARIVAACLGTEGSKQDRKEAMEGAGRRVVHELERNIGYLATLAAVGPLVGLLGTVTGMIRTFGVVGVVGVGDPIKLSGGIAEALLNTAAGMVVGIPALIAQHYYLNRVDSMVVQLEEVAERADKTLRSA